MENKNKVPSLFDILSLVKNLNGKKDSDDYQQKHKIIVKSIESYNAQQKDRDFSLSIRGCRAINDSIDQRERTKLNLTGLKSIPKRRS